MKENNFISLVIYLRNNSDIIEEFFRELDNEISSKFGVYEYILIDDFSEDDTIDKVKKLSKIVKGNITLIELPWKHGVEKAMLSGIDMAIGDFVYEFDSIEKDYEICIVLKLYYKMLEGYDIVAAVPKQNKHVTSKTFYKFLNHYSNKKIHITTETFRIISRRAINRVYKTTEKFRYRKILYHYSGFDTHLYGYDINKIIKAKNKMNLSEKIDFASDILIVFSDFGFKFSFLISLLFFCIGVFMMFYTIFSYIFIKQIQPGWTTIMLFLTLSFTGLFFILSIVIKYLNILIKEIQGKDAYIYKKTTKIN